MGAEGHFNVCAAFPQTGTFLRCGERSKGRTKAQSYMTNATEKEKKVSIASRITNTTMADFLSGAMRMFRVLTADQGRRTEAAGGCWSDKGDWLRFKYFN